MKRIAILAVLLSIAFHPALKAQEKEPLAMRILMEWTVGGLVVGAAVGAAIWLTDPGKAGNQLSEQLALGAAWGAFAGAGVGLSRLNSSAIPPTIGQLAPGPLHPSRRITSDPIGDEDRRQDLLAGSSTSARGRLGFVMPLFDIRF